MALFQPAGEPATELGRTRVLSRHAGVRVSPLQLGAMSIGEAWKDGMGSMDKEQSFKLLDAFYEAGGNFIDTANNYQDEESEAWIGEWMATRKNRDHMVIATKFTTAYRSYELGKNSHSVNFFGNHKRSMHVSVRDSLRKLQTDWIDVLYLHWWDYSANIPEIMDSLHVLVEQGKVMYLGVSDTPAWLVSAANEYAIARGKTPFAVYQGRWSLMARDFERDIIPMARYYGMALAPWGAMGGGKFQSRKAMAERKEKGEGLRSLAGSGEQTEQEQKISDALEEVAKEHNIESVTAVAIAYVMAKTPYVFPIIGGRKVEHLRDNIQALSIKLSDEQIRKLEEASPFTQGFPQNFIGEDPGVVGIKNAGALQKGASPMAYVQKERAIGHE